MLQLTVANRADAEVQSFWAGLGPGFYCSPTHRRERAVSAIAGSPTAVSAPRTQAVAPALGCTA